jgi:hypothetical protein
MASELERIANRLRFLSGQAEQHRATVHEASQRFKDAAQAIVRTKYETVDGLDRPTPQQLVGRLTQAAAGAESAIAPLTRTAGLLRGFAASLAASTAAPSVAPAAASEGYTPPAPPTPSAQPVDVPDAAPTPTSVSAPSAPAPPPEAVTPEPATPPPPRRPSAAVTFLPVTEALTGNLSQGGNGDLAALLTDPAAAPAPARVDPSRSAPRRGSQATTTAPRSAPGNPSYEDGAGSK